MEKRDEKRLRRRFRVRYGMDGKLRSAYTEDISEGGFYIKTAYIHRPGTTLHLEIDASEGTTVVMEGQVCWAKQIPANMIHLRVKGGMGVRVTRFVTGEELYSQLYTEAG